MANQSIYVAFQRMWVHVVNALATKSPIDHNHNDDYYIKTDVDTILSGKAEVSEIKAVTLTSTNWIGESAPYTQTLTVEGITASCNGLVSLGQDVSLEVREATRDAMLSILNQDENSITIVADGDKPSIDIPITVVIVH